MIGIAANPHGGYNRPVDPSLPFPPAPAPPVAPFMLPGWGSQAGAPNNNNNNNGAGSYQPGGTWQTAALYNGAFPQEAPSQIPQANDTVGVNSEAYNSANTPAPNSGSQVFSSQMRQRQLQSDPRYVHQHPHQHEQQQQQHVKTASGLEVQAMQRLVSSARTRFVPGNPGRLDQYEMAQEIEQKNMEERMAEAESKARREELLNKHRQSGGVAFEKRMREQRLRNQHHHNQDNNNQGGIVTHQSAMNVDGTFRRTTPPSMKNRSSFGGGGGSRFGYKDTTAMNSTYTLANRMNNNNTGGSSRTPKPGSFSKNSSSGIPLSQANTSQLTGIRPHGGTAGGTTTKSQLKGSAPNLKRALADGFALRFQPEQIEQMRLPGSVGAAASEAAQLRTAAGGMDNNNNRSSNPVGPETTLINGLGDMFQRIKSQYTQLQVHPDRVAASSSYYSKGGGGNKTISPPPRIPSPFRQRQLQQQQNAGGGGNVSPLRANVRGIQNSNNNNTTMMMMNSSSSQNNNNMSTTGNNNNNTSYSVTPPLYAIAGTGAHREQPIASPNKKHQHQQNFLQQHQQLHHGGVSPDNNNMNNTQQQMLNNHGSSSSSPSRYRNNNPSSLTFDAPKPSARALALRAELESLEVQWKQLHVSSTSPQNNNNPNINTSDVANNQNDEELSYGRNHHTSSSASRNQQQETSTRDSVLSRISAVLK